MRVTLAIMLANEVILAIATLTSRLDFLEIAGQSELLWQRAVSSVKGRAVGEWTDLIIC
jgi:hypothetical protein